MPVVVARLWPVHRTRLALRSFQDQAWRRRRSIRAVGCDILIELDGEARPYAVDGEVDDPVSSLSVRILPGALRVIGRTG